MYYGKYNIKRKERILADKNEVLAAMQKAGKPVRPGDVTTRTGIDKKEVSKLIAELKKGGSIISPKRYFYEPAK